MKAATVFISYSHDSPEHGHRVLELSDRLRAEGVDSILDQCESSPPEGWPRWMDKHIRSADFVLMVCTETYFRRVMGEEEKGRGLGVKWEGNLIYQHIYNADTKNTRFIPVLFEYSKVEHIPGPLQGATYYRIPQQYEDLYRRLTNQPWIAKPKLGILRQLPARERKPDYLGIEISTAKLPPTSPDLFGREGELEALDKAWENRRINVFTLVAWGGVGKTALVNAWLTELGKDNYRGAARVFGWSFYSQGAAEGRQVSADPFIAAALAWFGDPDPTKGSPWDKGERLAELVKQQPTVLILDGLEPLQNPPPVETGRIKDASLWTLLRELARQNPGVLVITTRLPMDDLKDFIGTSVTEIDLENLSPNAGAAYLKHLGVDGTQEQLALAAEEFGGHALALTLLGAHLVDLYDGDIRKRDLIPPLTEEEEKGGHAKRVLRAYEKWFEGRPEHDILRVMGLFDRPAEKGAIDALLTAPPIAGLTSELEGVAPEKWRLALKHLRKVRLLAEKDPDDPDTLDCHPLLREHFADRVRTENPDAWREANSRLFEYYKSRAKELPDTLEEMMPLYAAVAHGCQAGRHQEALHEVYFRRILRGSEQFSWKKLGSLGADLVAMSGFFKVPWRQPVDEITEHAKATVLNQTALYLRAVGRLPEAAQPLRGALATDVTLGHWRGAAVVALNLSEVYLMIGNLKQALQHARESVELAKRSGEWRCRMNSRTALAEALHQAGYIREAETAFREAEEIQKENQPEHPILYSFRGFLYCDLLLDLGKYGDVRKRVMETVETAIRNEWLLDIALDDLSLARSYLLETRSGGTGDYSQTTNHLNRAVDGLRQAGCVDQLPRSLLARAELYRIMGELDKARRELDEAFSIATRGGMRLYEADCHLEYARLYLASGEKKKARESFAKAKQMIEEMGYHRRDGDVKELEGHL